MNPRQNRWLRWSDEERETVRQLDDAGVRTRDVADALGRTPLGVARMRRLLRMEGRAQYRCGHCGKLKPAGQFVASQQLGGGYCDACRHAHRRRAEQEGHLPIG